MTKVSKKLQGVIAQMLKPLKGLPLSLVIEGLSGNTVLLFDQSNKKDIQVLEKLIRVANDVLSGVNQMGVLRTRPNEVGNDIELFVKKSLIKNDYTADTPETPQNKKKSTGYPDLEFIDEFNRHHYLECKTYNIANINTTQRSFYLSPSNNFKITKDAHHFGISFEIYVESSIKNNHLYKIKSWKILDLGQLNLSVKYEFNASNKNLYTSHLILAECNHQ